jgi:HPt (histidine-containing phosphotransfer) domain-containing protein
LLLVSALTGTRLNLQIPYILLTKLRLLTIRNNNITISLKIMSKLDLTYLTEISGGDKNFIREMLELFVVTTGSEAEQYDALLANSEYERLGSLAHKMKAPIQMLGANELFETIRKLETYGKERSNLDQIPVLIEKVKSEILLLKEEIVERLKTL